MKLNIANKLMIIMMLTTGLVVALIFGLTRFSILSGFSEYVEKVELSTLDTFGRYLELRYAKKHNWNFARDDKAAVWWILGASELHNLRKNVPPPDGQFQSIPLHGDNPPVAPPNTGGAAAPPSSTGMPPGYTAPEAMPPGYPPQGGMQPGYPPQGGMQPGGAPQGGMPPGYPPQGGMPPGYPPQGGAPPGYPPQGGMQPGGAQQGGMPPGN